MAAFARRKLHVGLVGLGNMGTGMGKNILRATFPLTVHDTEPARVAALTSLGANGANDGRMPLCEVIFLSLNTEAAGKEVIHGLIANVKKSGKTRAEAPLRAVVDLGTVSPQYCRAMKADCEKVGIGFLDAPVSGGPEGAANGKLCVMVGGSKETFELCLPVLQTIGENIFHMGSTGAGAASKLINQYLVIQGTIMACEAYVLSKRAGVSDTQALLDLLKVSWGQSRMVEKNLADLIRAEKEGPEALQGSPAPIRNLKKDLSLIIRAAEEAGVRLPLLPAATDVFDKAMSRGFGSDDFAQIARLLE